MAERKIHLSTAHQLEFISVSKLITDDELENYYTLKFYIFRLYKQPFHTLVNPGHHQHRASYP